MASSTQTPPFEFDAMRRSLYNAEELFRCFDPDDPATYADCLDVRIYREFVDQGGASTTNFFAAMMRALHDTCISQHIASYIGTRRVAAIMGGHGAARGTPTYCQAAHVAARLSARQILVASGGGPGAMEAIHLGASFGAEPGLDDAIEALASSGSLEPPKNSSALIRGDGSVDRSIASAIGKYIGPALKLARKRGPAGLGVPTWLYGFEPTTPLADGIGKYFQNSIREDGLLALATNGIVYVEGSAGTLQEIFQDAAQNYYHTFPTGPAGPGYFCPMVFLGEFWQKTLEANRLLEQLYSIPPAAHLPEYRKLVLQTNDIDRAVDFIAAFPPPPGGNKTLAALQAG